MKMLRAIIAYLDTRSWMVIQNTDDENDVIDDMAEVKSAAECIISVFREPLKQSQKLALRYLTMSWKKLLTLQEDT